MPLMAIYSIQKLDELQSPSFHWLATNLRFVEFPLL
jgi:hypothetical protein